MQLSCQTSIAGPPRPKPPASPPPPPHLASTPRGHQSTAIYYSPSQRHTPPGPGDKRPRLQLHGHGQNGKQSVVCPGLTPPPWVCWGVNGLHLYSAFIQSAVQFMPLIHTPTAIGCHARYQPARQEQLGVRCLAQGHFDTPRVGSNRQPSDCQMTALPPEPFRLCPGATPPNLQLLPTLIATLHDSVPLLGRDCV